MRLRAEIVAEEEKMRKKRHSKRMQVFRSIVEGTRMITVVGICLSAALPCFALLFAFAFASACWCKLQNGDVFPALE